MSDPHAATRCASTNYADGAYFRTVEVVENVPLAKDTWRVRFHSPEMARRFVPGQFLMMRLSGYEDPLLARPLALYDTVLDGSGEPSFVDVVYLVLGKMTTRLASFQPGRALDVWGPLGNGFPPLATEHLILVAGGIGQTPFLALAQECFGERQYGDPPRPAPRIDRITLCYGARRGEYLAGVADFKRRGVDVRISTDDGSAGHHGLVTDLLAAVLAEASGVKSGGAANRAVTDAPPRRIICCGPERMMEAVAKMALAAGVPCQASLETPMACGIGICFSCVAKIRDATGQWDYRRTCIEGPIFDATRIVW
jgi:dihydroorotate dehydrogenase electron transfer subunit